MSERQGIEFQREGYLALKQATNRYDVLPGPIAAVIACKPPRTCDCGYRFADLGCGDGELAWRLLSRHRKVFPAGPVELALIDTDPVMAAGAIRRFTDIPSVHARVHETCTWEYLRACPPGSLNLVLASHLLYHVERDRWAEWLRLVLSRLTRGGVAVIVMRSRAGEWWRIFDPLMASACPLMRQSFVFAEDLFERLGRSVPVRRKVQADYSATVEDGRHLIELVRFLYRMPEPQRIPQAVTQKLVEFCRAAGRTQIGFRDSIIPFVRDA